MRAFFAVLFGLCAAAQAGAREIVSEYTTLVPAEHCSVFEIAGEGEGDWAGLACLGYRGYPVVVYYADARDSVFYGFPPEDGSARIWESFEPFNAFGPTIEWRIERHADREAPFATIHRWFVSEDDRDAADRIEVLVIEKVATVDDRQGCAVGYVVATGNTNANEKARDIADNQARDFVCGDQPVIDAGEIPVPPFVRYTH